MHRKNLSRQHNDLKKYFIIKKIVNEFSRCRDYSGKHGHACSVTKKEQGRPVKVHRFKFHPKLIQIWGN